MNNWFYLLAMCKYQIQCTSSNKKNVMALADSHDDDIGFSLVETTTTTAPFTTKAAATVAIATTKQMTHELKHAPMFL